MKKYGFREVKMAMEAKYVGVLLGGVSMLAITAYVLFLLGVGPQKVFPYFKLGQSRGLGTALIEYMCRISNGGGDWGSGMEKKTSCAGMQRKLVFIVLFVVLGGALSPLIR